MNTALAIIGMERLDFGASESQLSRELEFRPTSVDVIGEPRIRLRPDSETASELRRIYKELDADIPTMQQEGPHTKPDRLQVRTTLLVLEAILGEGEVLYLDALAAAKITANNRYSEYHNEALFTLAAENQTSEHPRTMTGIVVDQATLAFATIAYAVSHLQNKPPTTSSQDT